MKKSTYFFTLSILIISIVLGFASPSVAAETYTLDPDHSAVVFRIKHLGIANVFGRFHHPVGRFTFDPQSPQKSHIQVQVAAKNVDTGVVKRDNHLRSADFFNVEKHPLILFESRSVKAKDQNDYAKNQRARAKEAEDSAKDRREEVKELAKELTKRPKTADTNLEQQTRRLRTISETGGEFSNSVVFSLGVTEATAVPMFYDLNWAEAERSSKDAVEAYRTALGFTWESDINFLTIVLSVAELSVENFEAEVTERQDRAALHDTTSAAAKQAATSVGDAAHVHEHAAILHYVKGALRYLDAKGVDTKAKKEIEQTIKFVESHMSRLPKPVAERAASLIATSREALK